MKKKEIKKLYGEEVKVVEEVIEVLCEWLQADGPYYTTDEQGNITHMTREAFLASAIEWSVDKLGGNVGYIFIDEMEV